MNYKKENLIKLSKLIEEISRQPDNYWFRDLIYQKLPSNNFDSFSSPKLEEIYEHCIRKIIKEHAEKFYSDFKLLGVKDKLIEDFVRMEKFRRDDNFEDFCLAAYQQLELIISTLLISKEFSNYFKENKDLPALLKYDNVTGNFIRRGNLTLGKLIFLTGDQTKINNQITAPIQGWFFNHKYRAVLFYYYFNKEIKTNTDLFDRIYDIGNFLYQGRNLNHRGSVQSQYQQNIIDDLIPNQHKYYFKFLGFLEDFVTTINKYI
jgi:hypothetical protein